MKTTKEDHEPAVTPRQPVAAGELPRPVADQQIGSWVIPIPGLAFDPPPREVRRHSAPNDPLGGTALRPDIADRLASRRGRGEPLPPDVAESMGDAMGADLNGVRIHTGAEPAALARSVQAVAFTQGTDIYFGAGSYAPRTPSGQRLLAHELAHTVQRSAGMSGGGGARRGPIIGHAADPAEAEADRIADSALSVLQRRAAVRSDDVSLGRTDQMLRRTASLATLRSCSLPSTAPDRPDSFAVSRPAAGTVGNAQQLRRMPAAFGTTTAAALKSGWGFMLVANTPWDLILKALRRYAALRVDQYDARTAALKPMPGLIAAWEAHHKVGTKKLDSDEKTKVAAIKHLRDLIDAEVRELADAGVLVNERTQGIGALRFKGDYLLEQVFQGVTTLTLGNTGLSVTKVQQALADMSHLGSDKVTGTFDADTGAGIRSFQQAQGVPESGIVDKKTMVKLSTIFQGHSVELALAQAPGVEAKDAPGEFVWGAAPAELTEGTRDLSGTDKTAATAAVKTSQQAGVGGLLPTFVSNLPGKGSYEARLKAEVTALAQLEYDQIARGMAAKRKDSDLFGWDQIREVAKRSKAATDAVFGKFAVGPQLAPGVSIHDAWDTKVKALKDEDALNGAANWRVEKLLTGHPNVRHLDKEHGAIQTRDAEKVIVAKVKSEIVASMRDELVETHKAWPAFAGGGIVNIQRFRASTDPHNRHLMWDLFQTVVHEYLHTLEHSRYRTYRGTLSQQEGDFTLREGVTEYFTHTVLDAVTYDDALRTAVEGEFHDDTVQHPIPRYVGYGERANAEKLAGTVGARNVMAAFFLGDVEKIGGTA
jgi:hypothetical protein